MFLGVKLEKSTDSSSSSQGSVNKILVGVQTTTMHPDLSPHLHSEECNVLIRKLLQCHKDNPFRKFLGVCNQEDTDLHKCLKKEYLQRLVDNKAKTNERRRRMGLVEQL